MGAVARRSYKFMGALVVILSITYWFYPRDIVWVYSDQPGMAWVADSLRPYLSAEVRYRDGDPLRTVSGKLPDSISSQADADAYVDQLAERIQGEPILSLLQHELQVLSVPDSIWNRYLLARYGPKPSVGGQTYYASVFNRGGQLQARDRMGLTWAVFALLDSLKANFDSLAGNADAWYSRALYAGFCGPKVEDRWVDITQRIFYEWPRARTDLLNAICYGRANKVIFNVHERGWRRGSWRENIIGCTDEFLSICDQFGVEAYAGVAKYTKYSFSPGGDLMTYIPVRRDNILPGEHVLPRTGATRMPNGNDPRAFVEIDFDRVRPDYEHRWWTVTCYVTPTGAYDIETGWYRSERNVRGASDGWVIKRIHHTGEASLTGSPVTIELSVPSLEARWWTLYLQTHKAAPLTLDSVTIREQLPDALVPVATTLDTSMWATYQRQDQYPYLTCHTPRFEEPTVLNAIFSTIDSVYAVHGHHPSLAGIFIENDEWWTGAHNPEFWEVYTSPGEAVADWANRIAAYARRYWPETRTPMLGDMFNPVGNAREYTRNVNPRGGGCLNSHRYLDRELFTIVIWTPSNVAEARRSAEFFATEGFSYVGSIDNGPYSADGPTWETVLSEDDSGCQGVFWLNWSGYGGSDDWFSPEVLKPYGDAWFLKTR